LGGDRTKEGYTGTVKKKQEKIEKEFGRHPTQKPLHLLDLILKASTNEKDLVLESNI
jgi:site-specific DNA-methyltransferase (adenine-specific)